MDAHDFDNMDVVELVMASEESFPDLKFPDHATRDDVIRMIQARLGDDPNGSVAVFVQRKGPSGRGGSTAVPDEP